MRQTLTITLFGICLLNMVLRSVSRQQDDQMWQICLGTVDFYRIDAWKSILQGKAEFILKVYPIGFWICGIWRVEFNSNRTGLDTNMAALLFIYFLFATPPWWPVTADVFPVYFSGGEKRRPEIRNTSAFAGCEKHGGSDVMSKGCIK